MHDAHKIADIAQIPNLLSKMIFYVCFFFIFDKLRSSHVHFEARNQSNKQRNKQKRVNLKLDLNFKQTVHA